MKYLWRLGLLLVALGVGMVGSRGDASAQITFPGQSYVVVDAIRPGGTCASPNPDNGANNLHGWKVPAGGLTYKFVAKVPNGLDLNAVESAIQAAAASWDSKTGATLLIYGGRTSKDNPGVWNGQSSIGFGNVPGGAIAVAFVRVKNGEVVEADVVLGNGFKWSTNNGLSEDPASAADDCTGADGKMDVNDITTHEIGHVIGVAHTSDDSVNNAQTMFPFGSYRELFKRSPAGGDTTALTAIYGP